MAEALDFQIDTMKFRLAIDNTYYSSNNTGRRYVRSTAPFKKDQIDSSQQVGDQSLVGWWTRGQLSFHKGEGVKYYEVLNGGDVVLNRFRTGEHLDTFHPGTVTLGNAPVSRWNLVGTDPTVDAVTVDDNVGAAWVMGSSLYIGLSVGGGGTLCSNALGTPTPFLAAGGGYIYNATDGSNGIVRYFSAGAGESLYTSTSQINGLWYGKNRLWMADLSGSIYALPDSPSGTLPAAVGSSDIVFTIPSANSPASAWAFAEGNSATFFGLNENVYAVRPDSSGAIPTLTSGVVVLTLARGEKIKSMCGLLGRIVICTNLGIRVALEQSDGSLVSGPLFVRGSGACREMGAHGSYVYALLTDVENHPPGTRIVRVDLDTEVSTLAQAYDSTAISLTNSQYQGITAAPDGAAVYGADGSGAYLQVWDSPSSSMATQGELTTGFHRLGTLEPKLFQYLRVKTEGTVGTVAIDALLPDGSVANIGTLSSGDSLELPMHDAVPDPQEYVGLKFTLTGDSTDGPVLLGYQLKALPVPKRQRLIQVPLLLRDVITTANGRKTGREGDAWKNLQALEALESSKAVVTYTDFRTGETGTAYIDGVEFTGDIETSHRTREFGGIAYVELRVIS